MVSWAPLITTTAKVMLTHPNINPVAIEIGSLQVHWYGIMYMFAFATAWLIAYREAKRSHTVLETKHVEDLIVYGAMGVIIGGRIGYIVFYNFSAWMSDFLLIFRIWEGGMSFHGGLLGVIAAIYLYSRKIKTSFLGLLDFIAVISPLGLGFGRIGNFIGQELWGRETDVNWGMVFPNDEDALVRHPSQLYQAFLEGLVLFCIVYWFTRKPRPRFAAAGLFILGYGIFRFFVEFFREPDAHLQDLAFGWMTRGQILTMPMIAGGIVVMLWAYHIQKPQNHDDDTKTSTANKPKKPSKKKKS